MRGAQSKGPEQPFHVRIIPADAGSTLEANKQSGSQ